MTSRLLLLVLAFAALSGAASAVDACEMPIRTEVLAEPFDEATETTELPLAAVAAAFRSDRADAFVGVPPAPPPLRPPRR